MFEGIKEKIAKIIIRKKYLSKTKEAIVFNNFFIQSKNFIVLMPSEASEMTFAKEIVDFLVQREKNITLVIPVGVSGQIEYKSKYTSIIFTIDDYSKLNLPNHNFVENINKKLYDVVIDLEIKPNYFYSALSNMLDAKYRIGFKKDLIEDYYNFQLSDSSLNPEITYKNLIASLKMF